jgi:hypothetical protein
VYRNSSVGIATGYGLGGMWIESCRSQWLSGLRRGSAADRLLGLRVRTSPGAWMFVLCVVSKEDKKAKYRTVKSKRKVRMKYRIQENV